MGHWTPAQPSLESVVQPDVAAVPGADDRVWDAVPWLEPFRDVPVEGRWPRYMTGPHPRAVGSYGADALVWLADVAGLPLRWWQALVLTRQLEHDDSGRLVWLNMLVSTSRQSGKSTFLRSSSTWRLHQAVLFGEPQTILHTGKDLPICKEVQGPAMRWAKERKYPHRESNGQEEIVEPVSGSRWLIRSKDGIYGYGGSLVLVDETWGVAPDVIDDGLEPTMLERRSPQLVLASTAHRKATVTFPTRRHTALDQLCDPTQNLLVEWSAPRDSDIDDPAGWRASSPHWSAGRERLLHAKLELIHAGEYMDPDEDDPVESFLAQYLNVWPIRVGPNSGDRLLPEGLWAQARLSLLTDGPVFVAVEDNYGSGAAVAAVGRLEGEDLFEVDGWTCDSWDQALDGALALLEARPQGSRLIVGNAVSPRTAQLRGVGKAGSTETRLGLALLRDMVRAGRVVHDETPDLDAQIDGARVRDVPGGGLALMSSRRSDCLRAAVWALREAHQRTRVPSIR